MSKKGKIIKKESKLIGRKSIKVTRKPDRSGLIKESTYNSTKSGMIKKLGTQRKKTKQPQKIGRPKSPK